MAPQLIVEMTADEAKVFSAQQKVIRQQEKMVAKYKELAQAGKKQTNESERAARSHDKAFGQGAQGALTAFAGGLTKVAGIAASLAPAFAASSAELQKNLELLRGAEGGLAQLAQLARTPEEFQALQQEARAVYAAGGAPDLDTAAQRLFSVFSAGLDNRDRQFVTELGASGLFGDTGQLATAINTMQTTMRTQAGTARDLVNAGLEASAGAPSMVPALLAATARSSSSGARLGFSPQELLAATTLASRGTGGAETGGTNVASLMQSIGDNFEQFQGMSLARVIQDIQGRNLSPSELKDLLGRDEAIKAFDVISQNLREFRELQSKIRTSQETNIVDERLGFIASDPTLRNLRRTRTGEAQATLNDESRATQRALFDALVNERIAANRAAGVNEVVLGAARAGQSIVHMLGLERMFVNIAGQRSPDDQRRVAEELRAIDALRESRQRFARQGNQVPPAQPQQQTRPPRPRPDENDRRDAQRQRDLTPPMATPERPDPNDRQAPQMPPPPGPTPRERNIPDDGRPIPVDIGMDDMLRMRDVPVMPSIRPDLTATRDRPQIIADRPVERVPMPTLDRVGDRQQDRQQSQDVLANLNRSSDTTAMAEVARQQLDVARQQLEALRQLTDQRSRPPAVPQLSAARHEQAQSAETGK